jgi:hypothetical protein
MFTSARIVAILLQVVLKVHIVLNCAGLAAFWVAVCAPKGGQVHIRCGKVFVWCVYGMLPLAALIIGYKLLYPLPPGKEPPGGAEERAALASQVRSLHLFLGYGGLLTLACVRQGIRAVQTRSKPEAIRSPFHLTLIYTTAGAGPLVLPLSLGQNAHLLSPVVLIGPVGCFAALRMLRFVRSPRLDPMAWWYEHMGWMLTTGILLHTALASFLIKDTQFRPQGIWSLLFPWVLLPALGLVACEWWKRRYRRGFREGHLTNGK